MNTLEKGWIDYLFGGVRVRCPAGALCVRWAAIPHQSLAMKQVSTHFSLKLPFAWFMRWNPPKELINALLGGSIVADRETAVGCSNEAMFRRWAALFRDKSHEPGRTVALEAEARLRRAALRMEGPKRDACTRTTARAQLGSVERMTIFVAENDTRPLSIDEIAEAARLHPNSAMRLFRRSCGITLLEYVNPHRIWHAQRLLKTVR